jgi:hypothetical protein
MILLKILDHDLHMPKGAVKDSTIWWIETPARSDFLPAVVSSTRGEKFLVNRKLTGDGRIRSGVFTYDSDRLDEILMPLFTAAYELSVSEKWHNLFTKPKEAFDFIQKNSNPAQPHIVLIPEDWSRNSLIRWAGKANLTEMPLLESKSPDKRAIKSTVVVYSKICKVVNCKTPVPIFLSRPDFVGMYTQIAGGKTSILLHNIKRGMAFCPRAGDN